MSAFVPVTEWRCGRNFIRLGDTVHVAPSRPRKRDGFDSRVRALRADPDTGAILGVEVVDPHKAGAVRVVRPERISRRRQTTGGQ